MNYHSLSSCASDQLRLFAFHTSKDEETETDFSFLGDPFLENVVLFVHALKNSGLGVLSWS